MSIQDWGAIAEAIGAAAVVVTLIYLTVQLRQTFMSAHPVLPLVSLVLLALACGQASEPEQADPASRRLLTGGPVVGFAIRERAHAWLGLPFAQPPTGDRRWRAPSVPQPWKGERTSTQAGPSCPQFANLLSGSDGDGVVGDEDCLYLTVSAPAFEPGDVPGEGRRLPVLFWIHGGGNTAGTGGRYDGSRLAVEQSVIVVTTNFRLGALGWFRHPALTATAGGPRDASGNYGTLDLVRALEWVRDEIGTFGGDPENVTLFGESDGATNVYSLLVAPPAKGLFHRAISQSGATQTTSIAEAQTWADQGGHAYSSREIVARLLARDGAESPRERANALSDAETTALLRSKSAVELLEAHDPVPMAGVYPSPRILRDGSVLPEAEIDDLIAAGRFHRVPVMLGTNRDESKLFMVFSSPHVWRLFWVLPILRDGNRYDRDAEYSNRLWKEEGVDRQARAMVAAGHQDVYAYRFDWDEQGRRLLLFDLSRLIGASHGLEVSFVFNTMGTGPLALLSETDEEGARDELARTMRDYWAEFARTGNPGTGGVSGRPRWSAWSNATGGPTYAILDTPAGGGVRMASTDNGMRDDIFDAMREDPRFANAEERCLLMQRWVDPFAIIEPAEYEARGCTSWPLSDVAAQ